MNRTRIAILALVLSGTVSAQWIKYKTPGLPRTADGKPDLAAPAPKTADGKPDLSGLWHIDGLGYATNLTSDLKPGDILPWAEAVYKQRVNNLGNDSPTAKCLPPGPSIGLFGELQKFIQAPGLLAVLNEQGIFRQIFTDARALPEDPTPAWQGYSTAHWDADTLVVETAGFNDKSWLDFSGHPHTDALRVTERYHRKDFGHMELKMTYEDPKTFTKPFSIAVEAYLVPDTDLLEFVCNENERDAAHLVGKLSDEKKGEVKVDPSILAKYVGTYHFMQPSPMDFGVTLSEGNLMMDINKKGPSALIPLSQTTFFNVGLGAPVEFIADSQGKVTTLEVRIVEGDLKGARK